MSDVLQQFSLAGRVAVVVGASQGIGQGLAITLATAGADLVLASRREDKLRETQTQIEALGRRAAVFGTDVNEVDNIRELREFVRARFGKADILVNAAAVSVKKAAWEVTEQDWDLMIDTGLKGLFFCCQIIGSLMREAHYGKIINLSSTFSRSLIPNRSVYATLKAGVSHLTEALATEWAKDGIRVNALGPTATLTPSAVELANSDRLPYLASRIPLGRLAVPDDLAGAVVYLASPASDFVTGHTLFVDGGWLAAS